MASMWAAIDIGSNTVQLLVAESVDNHFRPHFHALRTTRLGACSQPGLLDAARIADTLSVLSEYAKIIAQHQVSGVRVIATSAVRDAANRDELLDAALALTGWPIEVLSGPEEARISFLGAARAAVSAGAEHILLIDIGGSSSELTRWRQSGMQAVSADVGAVRAQTQGWDASEISRRLAAVIGLQEDDASALAIGAGGTITTAAGLLLECREYSREAIEGYRLTRQGVEQLLHILRPLSLAQRCAFSPLLARRGEIIYEGLLILREFFEQLGLPYLLVSGGGVLDGCLLDLKMNGRVHDER